MMGFLLTSMLLLTKEKALLLMMMAISYGDMVSLSTSYKTSLFGFVLLAFAIKGLIHLRIKGNTFILYCVFALYMIAGLRIGQVGLLSDVQTVVNLLILYLVASQFDSNYINRYFYAFIGGHLIATLASLLIRHTERYSKIVSEHSVQLLNSEAMRFSGMQLDPNFFALFCVMVIAILLYMLANKAYSKNSKSIVFLINLYLLFGVLSLSKMFMGAVMLIALYFYLCRCDIAPIKKVISVFLFGGVFALINLFTAAGVYDMIVGRFLNLNENYGERINAMTTGRYQIWMSYINDWGSSVENILFGVGLAHKKIEYLGKMHHQTFIELLYQFGILGTSLFCAYLVSLYRMIKEKIENCKIDLKGDNLGAVGIVVILSCSLALGLFALNVNVYLLFFAFIILANSRSKVHFSESKM